MKDKKILLIIVAFMVMLCAAVVSVKTTVYAFTITEDGEYVLIMWADANDSSATVEGSSSKAVKFNFDDGEESVRLGDLTNGTVAFNGKNAFSGWALGMFDTNPAPDDTLLTPDDFRGSGAIGGVEFNKGKVVYPLFNGDPIEEKTYYIKLNPFGGKVNGQDSMLLTYKADEFKTVDLTSYVPTRSGYSFCGWSLNDKIVTSIDASYFQGDTYALTVVALYKKNDFDPDGQFFLTLDANGGTIDGDKTRQYNYINGKDSGTSMPLTQYVPVRRGCKFKGWNSRKDGSGTYYSYIYWRNWQIGGDPDLDRDTLSDDGITYKNVTLYAAWEVSLSDEFVCDGSINGSVKLPEAIDGTYELHIDPVEISKNLKGKNVRYLVDIYLTDESGQIIDLGYSGTAGITVKAAIPETLNGYDRYEVVYVKEGDIKEHIQAVIEEGYVTFTTMHLSQYGVVAVSDDDDDNTKSTTEGTTSATATETTTELTTAATEHTTDTSVTTEATTGVSTTESTTATDGTTVDGTTTGVTTTEGAAHTGKQSPDTGDPEVIMLVAFILNAAMIGVCLIILSKKNKKNDHNNYDGR